MRLGSHSRFGCVIFLCSLVVAPVLYSSFAYANPVVLGLARLFAGMIGRRALTLEAEQVAEGVYVASMERATAQSLASTVRTRMANIATNSSLRVKGVGTWGTLALSSGMMSLSDLQSGFQSGTLSFKTDGVAVGNGKGKYKVNLGNGETKIVDFKPSQASPVLVYQPSSVLSDVKPIVGVETGYSVPKHALFSIQDTVTNQYYYGQKSADVAVSLAKVDIPRRYPDNVLIAKGDNTTFEYTDRGYTFDIHFLATAEEGTTYPEGVLGYEGVGGLPSYFLETVEAKIKTKKLSSDFKACRFIDVTDIKDNKPLTSSKYYCEPPKPADYVVTESSENKQYLVSTNTKYKPLDQMAVGTLDDVLSHADLKTKLSNEVLAKLLNNLLMEAATQENYQGIPFTSSKPITASEVKSLLKELNLTVSYDDLFSAVPTDTSSYVINKTDVNVDIDDETDIDLGEDPHIKPPDLSDPPTGKKILSPIIELMPFIKTVNVAVKEVSCPVWKFELWDKQYSIESHCLLLEKIRFLLKSVFLLIWGLVSLRLILTA